MKKKLVCLLAVFIFLIQPYTVVSAKSRSNQLSPATKIAIKKYRSGNYTGCLQECQRIINSNPSNAYAYYYMAMSYVHAGKQNEAIRCYSTVLSLKPNSKMLEYATMGKRCLETPDQCVLKQVQVARKKEVLSDLDKFIASPSEDGFSSSVRSDFRQKRLDSIKNEINQGQELNPYSLQKINYSDTDNIKKDDKILIAQNKPTDEEIKNAIKVLNDAGISPYSNSYQNPDSQNQDLMQLNALMGGNSQNGNNAMLNMLPYMMMQNKDGSSNYSPQLIQATIMNSMMTDFNYDVDNNK